MIFGSLPYQALPLSVFLCGQLQVPVTDTTNSHHAFSMIIRAWMSFEDHVSIQSLARPDYIVSFPHPQDEINTERCWIAGSKINRYRMPLSTTDSPSSGSSKPSIAKIAKFCCVRCSYQEQSPFCAPRRPQDPGTVRSIRYPRGLRNLLVVFLSCKIKMLLNHRMSDLSGCSFPHQYRIWCRQTLFKRRNVACS